MRAAMTEMVSALSFLPGVAAAMVVGADDGLIVEASAPRSGQAAAADQRRHTAALAAYLYGKVGRASNMARLGIPAFMRLEAEGGQVCIVGSREVVLVAILDRDANLGRVRLEMMQAAQSR